MHLTTQGSNALWEEYLGVNLCSDSLYIDVCVFVGRVCEV